MSSELSVKGLATQIEETRKSLKPGEHLQVCLWFADGDDLESLDYLPEVVPVVSATITIHDAGGSIARGGDHLDFAVNADETKSSEELAEAMLADAAEYAAESFCSPWNN